MQPGRSHRGGGRSSSPGRAAGAECACSDATPGPPRRRRRTARCWPRNCCRRRPATPGFGSSSAAANRPREWRQPVPGGIVFRGQHQAAQAGRENEARADGIDVNAARLQLRGPGPGKAAQRGLSGAVMSFLAAPGCELFVQTTQPDAPNTPVCFEVFAFRSRQLASGTWKRITPRHFCRDAGQVCR